jgi:uncharacterized protein YhfF
MKAGDYWKEFLNQHPELGHRAMPPSYYYGDNKTIADEYAELVVKNIKRATTSSLWWFQKHNEPLPQPGDLAIVTNWEGQAKAIVRTTKVEIVKFKDISPAYALTEGEGDKSLAYWKKVHWEYYANELKPFAESPNENMDLVCEHFETL